jgi:hypothetical protein
MLAHVGNDGSTSSMISKSLALGGIYEMRTAIDG